MFSIEIDEGDVYEHRTAGGGGWGDPLERDPAAVAARRRCGRRSSRGPQVPFGLYGVAVATGDFRRGGPA